MKKKIKKQITKCAAVMAAAIMAISGSSLPASAAKKCNHNYQLIQKRDATCTKGGSYKYKCRKCNATKTTNTKKLGHAFGNVRYELEHDNQRQQGRQLKIDKCSRCGYEETKILSVHKHNFVYNKAKKVYKCTKCAAYKRTKNGPVCIA